MYKLIEDAKVMAAVRKEVEEVVEAKRTGANESEYEAEFTTEDINKLPVVGKLCFRQCRAHRGTAFQYSYKSGNISVRPDLIQSFLYSDKRKGKEKTDIIHFTEKVVLWFFSNGNVCC